MTPNPATTAADDFVIQLALEHGLLHEAQVDATRALVRGHSNPDTPAPRLIDVLAQQGVLDARKIAAVLATEFGMPMAPDLTNIRITGDTLEIVPRAVAAKHRLIPLAREGGKLRVAISDPLDTDGLDALAYMLKMPIEPVVATAEEITSAIDRFYGKDANSIDELLNDLSVSDAGEATADHCDVGDDCLLRRGIQPRCQWRIAVIAPAEPVSAGGQQPRQSAEKAMCSTLTDGAQVQPVERRRACHRQALALTLCRSPPTLHRNRRREPLVEGKRSAAMRTGADDPRRQRRRQDRVAGKAMDQPSVESKAQRLAAVDGGALEAVLALCRQAIRLLAHVRASRAGGAT